MQAIRTVYLGATSARGSRIKATAAAGSVTQPYDDGLGMIANHQTAAETFRDRYGWNADGYGHLVSGCLADGSYCHVMTGRDGKGDN